MDSLERPEKRRKLDEVQDVPETINGQTPSSQMTLGERKRKGPRVLVNKMNVNHDVIERLRRITKLCGKQMAAGKMQIQTAEMVKINGSNPTENKKEVTNGFDNEKDEEKRLPQENGSKESPDKDTKQSITPVQNGLKHVEPALTENGHGTSEDDDSEIQRQTAADVDIFRQVLKEVIEQRTKIVEEAVAANSIKLQNRIRELERENRELQWNARKLFGAFRQFIIENEKKKRSKTSQSIQVNIDSNLESEVPVSPVIPLSQNTTVAKPSVQVTTAGEMVASGPTTPVRPTSLPTNVATSRPDPGLAQPFQKSTVQQSSAQVPSKATSHSQPKSTEPRASTAVVYTVKPRPTQLTVQQDGNKQQNRVQVSHANAIETNTSYLQTRTGQSSEPPVSKTFQQPRPLEPRKSSSSLPPDTMSPSQTNSSPDVMRQNQLTLLQQRERLQQQQKQQQQQQHQARASHTSISPAQQQHPSETTASLLQQLQRQQQLQQQHHYQRVVQQQQNSQVRHLLPAPAQTSQQEQHRKQQSETPISSISAPAQRQQDPSPQQRQQQQPNGSSSSLLEERRQLIRSPAMFTLQQRNLPSNHQIASQRPVYSLVQRQSHSQPSTVSNVPPASVAFNATLLNNVLKGDGRTLMASAGTNQISIVPSGRVPLSHSTSPNQTSVSNPRSNLVNSNTLVQDHINKIVNRPNNGRIASPVQATPVEIKENPSAGGQQRAVLQRQETAIYRSSSPQDASIMQFRKSFPGETFHARTELATTQRFHSRPPPESFQQQVQHPNTQMQQQERKDKQPQPTSIHNNSTLERGQEKVSTVEGSQLPRGASSALPTAAVSNYRKLEPNVPGIQQSILVPARKKHTDEELLPAGYRFSLPSPEYLLQRQRLQRTQIQPQHPQIGPPSKNQSLQNISSTKRVTVSSGQTNEQKRMAHTMQSPAEDIAAIRAQPRFLNVRNDTTLNQTSRNEVLPPSGHQPSSEKWLPQQKQQGSQVHQPRQTHQFQSRSNQAQQHLQGKQQLNPPSVANEGETRRLNLQSLYRQPIQSPGISSSDPRSEKHPQDAEMTGVPKAAVAITGNSSNDQGDANKPLPKPSASIAVMDRGIVLSWNMEHDDALIDIIDNYELFACQDVTESKGQPIKWKKIGIVKALPLPMACTLTQFSSGSKYFFSVRAVDQQERAGPFSDPCTVALNPS